MYRPKKGKENVAVNGHVLATASQEQLKEFYLLGVKAVEKVEAEPKPEAKPEGEKPKNKRKKKTDSEN